MFTLKQLLTLALAGSAIAAPFAQPHRRGNGDFSGPRGRLRIPTGGDVSNGSPTEAADAVVTVYAVPNGRGNGRGRGGNSDDDDDDSAPSVSVNAGSDSGSDTGSDAPSSGSDTGYMAIVNKYRSAGGLPSLTQSSKLEANARKTAADGNGRMVHQLNPGSMGQVLAPGSMSKFESIYVGGWLCEMPSLKGLNGACSKMTAGWDHSNGDTGHAEILSSTRYKAIGCAEAGGIVSCDLGTS